MYIVWLESLLALLEHGSFSRAADALHISQPAFSRRIHSLERWAGTELVDRTTFPVSLTPAGDTLSAHARGLVVGLAEVRDDIRGQQTMPHQAVRLGISHTLAAHYFAPWWKLFANDDPELTCRLLPSNTLEAYDALLHGGCDLLLAYADPVRPLGIDWDKVEYLVVARDTFAPYSRVLKGQPKFKLPGTASHPVPYVSHGQGAFLGRVTERLLTENQAHLRPIVQSDFTSALAELVAAGVGVGWLPAISTSVPVNNGTLVQLGDATWSADLEIRLYRHRSTHAANPSTAQLWDRAKTVAQRQDGDLS